MTQDTTLIPGNRRLLLRRAVAQDRVRLNHALGDLQTAVQTQASLGRQIRQRPYHWIVGGLIVGCLVGLGSPK